MLLRVALSMETLQLAGEGAKNEQEKANYKNQWQGQSDGERSFPAKPVTYMASGHDRFVTPNFKNNSLLLLGVGRRKEMESEVFPQNAV